MVRAKHAHKKNEEGCSEQYRTKKNEHPVKETIDPSMKRRAGTSYHKKEGKVQGREAEKNMLPSVSNKGARIMTETHQKAPKNNAGTSATTGRGR